MRVTSVVLRTAVSAVVGLGLGLGLLTAPAYAAAPAGVPVLSSPADGTAVSSNPVLTWTPVAAAAKYRVQVSTSPTFSPIAWQVDTVNVNATPETDLPIGPLFWRVAATDGATGIGTWSDAASFTKDGSSAPNPFGGADVQVYHYPSQTPVLQWEAMPGVKSYKVEIDDEDGFISSPSYTTPNTSLAVTSAVIFNKPYYWRVSGVMPSGAPTANSSMGTFMVDWPLATGQPELLSPASGVIDAISDVVLRWAPVEGAKTYQVQVNANPDFTNGSTDDQIVTGTQYSPEETYLNGAYFWRVRAIDPVASRQGPWSEARSFRRATPIPDAPELTSPVDNATAAQFAFSWAPVPTASMYEVQWDADGNFGAGALACTTFHTRFAVQLQKLVQPAATPTYPPNPASPATARCNTPPAAGVWHWRVRAVDQPSGQPGPFSDVRTVTYAPTAAGGSTPPQLSYGDYLSPANCEAPGCSDTMPDTPELSWNAVAGADHYIVYIAYDRQFTTEVQRYDVPGTRLTPRESLHDNATGASYYWWVQPCSSGACASNDQTVMQDNAHAFQKLAAPVVPVFPLGADQETVTDVVALQWQDSFVTQPDATGTAKYRVQVANDVAFNSLVDDATVDQTTYEAYTTTYADGNYYWRVQAIDGAGQALSWSAPQSFAKTSSQPQGLSVSRLDPNSAVPVLSWDSTSYVSGYIVEIYSGTSALFPPANLKKTVTVKLPVYTPDVAFAAGTYSWRVRRLDPTGKPGPWQDRIPTADGPALPTFDVAAPKPALLTPDDGASLSGNGLLFTWSPVQGAALYTFEASTVSNFASIVQRQTTVMNAWAPALAYPDSVPIYWRVKALDSASNVVSISTVRTVTKDGKAPTATVAMTGPTTLRPTATVSFSEDVVGVTAASVLLRKVTGGVAVATTMTCKDAAAATVPCTGNVRKVVLAPSANVVPGEKYQVAVTTGVADLAGNLALPYVYAFRAVLTVEQNSGSPTFSSGWSTASNTSASGGSYIRTTTKSASSSWVFRGTSVRVTYMATASSGRMNIYVDGVLKGTIDQFSSSTVRKYYTFAGLTDAVHTLKLVDVYTKATASKGYYVSIDALGTT
jgi:hypothetical protein